jgi:hypothetical protein
MERTGLLLPTFINASAGRIAKAEWLVSSLSRHGSTKTARAIAREIVREAHQIRFREGASHHRSPADATLLNGDLLRRDRCAGPQRSLAAIPAERS